MVSGHRKSILLITLSNIGDVILTTPVIASLRSTFPDARLTVVVGPKAVALLQGSGQIDRLLVYDKWAGWAHRLELVRRLREHFYDYVVDLRNSALPFLVRADRRSPIFRRHRSKRAREQHLEVLRWMKLPVNGNASFDFFSEEDETSLFKKLASCTVNIHQPWAVVAPGAGSKAKRWRIEGFCQVVNRLLEVSTLGVAAVGDASEGDLCNQVSQLNGERVVNLAGRLTLKELAALVQRAKLVLTNDSAVMHLGYELCRPVVAIFGPTDHERYGRENEIWRIVREASSSDFHNLSPEGVLRACEEVLAR